ncbi:outer membrane beta-barrel protein [Chitinophaga eiseniae]|uniref:PorT family protein n=1 Tax=Chitinophaga eiseniae TaxID=634771 RepID=A0A847SMB9_9BACT|nr:outer membrane beta-barrel protein [Chitinophaga eiseniae]NLR78828.1 PorT family protein [Chitinophaga eiseniae]
MKFFTLFSTAIVVIVLNSHAQVSLGIHGGYVNSGLESSGTSISRKPTTMNSWHAGVYFNVPLFKNGYLTPGLDYIVKGARWDYTISHPAEVFTSGTSRMKLRYLELPVNMVYKVPIGIGKFTIGAGPYAAYCLSGKYDLSVYTNGKEVQSSSHSLDFKASPNIFGTDMNLQRWDAGLNFTAGLEFNCFLTLKATYGYGMVDIDKSANNEFKNRYWGVSLGFLFDREDW